MREFKIHRVPLEEKVRSSWVEGAEQLGVGESVTVYDADVEAIKARAEQDLENEQVRWLERTGQCPCCGHQEQDG